MPTNSEQETIEVDVSGGYPVLDIDGTRVQLIPEFRMDVNGEQTLMGEDLEVEKERTEEGTHWNIKTPVDELPDVTIYPWVMEK